MTLVRIAIFLLSLGYTNAIQANDHYQFKVYLDDNEIGYHNFTISEEGNHVSIDAAFRVKFLFFTAYDYRHLNKEEWQAGCIKQIQSETSVNGRSYSVIGELSDDGLKVSRFKDSDSQNAVLPECAMTFAYWDPRLLDQSRLLNSQTGEYTPIEIIDESRDTINVRGVDRETNRYRLKAGKLEIDLWYTTDHEWVGLMSNINGRRLRYELI
ncbi:MAG TPA: hypothetical protein DCM54_16840 [Gammaproteobacteria bacterium]|nr:hypothetical protein [Gammaproteobacteria bacterium]